MQTDFLFLAWLAGFVDGEGCITLTRSRNTCGNPTYTPVLIVSQSDKAVLDLIAARLGVGGVYRRNGRKGTSMHKRPAWNYVVNGRAALAVVAALRPYLVVKREQADALLAYRPVARGVKGPRDEQAARYAELRAPQEAIYLRLRDLKSRPLVTLNTG